MSNKKRSSARMGYSEQDIKDTRVFKPGEDRKGYKGLAVQDMDWNNPVEVQKLRDLQAKYGIKPEGSQSQQTPGLPPPPQTDI